METSVTLDRPYLTWPVYAMPQAEKSQRLAASLSELTLRHADRCEPYRKILQAHGWPHGGSCAVEQIPFIPVRMFKEYELSSIDSASVHKVLSSSGTTSQRVSKIMLDRDTAMAQSRALVSILQQFLGKARLPMLIIDHPRVIKNRAAFSARGAGILGLSTFGRDHTYALRDEDMTLDLDAIAAFAERHRGQRVLLFGFTFMVWKYFAEALRTLDAAPRFDDAVLIHSGGWKKLHDEAVDDRTFRQVLADTLGIRAVHNFYGMVEQVGSVFVECEHGRLHTPAFAEVLIRDARDWLVLPAGRPGLIQVLSLLPTSYPGHSLLTEDVGEWTGVDDCPCGRLGRTFRVHGRVPRAEVRGCSDTHGAATGTSMEIMS